MKGVLFYQDNAPAHKSMVAHVAVCDYGFELVDHPPYSPDLALSDYFLFLDTHKKHLAGKQYQTDDEVKSAVEDFFEDQDESLELYSRKSNHCNTNGRSVWIAGKTMLKNKPHLVKFDHCIIVSLCTFQPTVVQWNLAIKRSDITKPSNNKVSLLVPALYMSLIP